jgi:CheY-like chemotaxis protein
MRILIADDDPVGRTFLTRILTKWGHDVTAVVDGDEAWRVIDEGHAAPRLLILDWMMPGLSGVDICARVRANHNQPYSYIILLTGRRETADVIHGLEAGADTYLKKPVGPPELRVRLKTAERVFALEARLQGRIGELHKRIERLGGTPDSLSDRPDSAEGAPAPGQDPLGNAPRILYEVLTDLGAEASAIAAGAGEDVAFHARTAIVLRRTETWMSLDMFVGRRAAEAIYAKLVGESPRTDADLLDALAEVLNMCQGALKLDLESEGFEPMTPVLPSAGLRTAPAVLQPGSTSFFISGAIRFSFSQSPARVVLTPITDLKPHDILADPIRDPDNDQIVFLSRGISLNDRYIERIGDLISSGRVKIASIPVIAAALP